MAKKRTAADRKRTMIRILCGIMCFLLISTSLAAVLGIF